MHLHADSFAFLGLLKCSQVGEMHTGTGMQEAIQFFGLPETFTSSHQRNNCCWTANTFLSLSQVQEAVVCICVCLSVCVCVWICGKARACLFNSADSGLLEDLGEVVNNVSGQSTCANTSNKPRYEETADFYLGHLFCRRFQLCLSNFYWCTS